MTGFKPSKDKKRNILIAGSVLAFLVIAGSLYYTWPKLFVDDKGMPPILSTGNVKSTNFQGVVFDTGSSEVFGTKTLKYTDADVAAWGTDPAAAGKIHVDYPTGKNYIIAYFYSDMDLTMMDIIGKSAVLSDAQVIKPKAGMNVAVAFYTPGETINEVELKKGYYLFPKGYFVNQKLDNGQIQTLVQGIGESGLVEGDLIDGENEEFVVDASEFVIPAGRGFAIIASEPFDAWNMKPSSIAAAKFGVPAELKYQEDGAKVSGKGWVLMPLPENVNEALGKKVENHRITDIWYSADQESFTQLSLAAPLPISLPGNYNMAWIYFDKPSSSSD